MVIDRSCTKIGFHGATISVVSFAGDGVGVAVAVAEQDGGEEGDDGEDDESDRSSNPAKLCHCPCQR